MKKWNAGWPALRPVQARPTGALRALKVEDEEMRRIAQVEGLEPLESGAPHRTRVHYRRQVLDFELADSRWLGEIRLKR